MPKYCQNSIFITIQTHSTRRNVNYTLNRTRNGICKTHHLQTHQKHTHKKEMRIYCIVWHVTQWFPAYYKLHMLFRVRLLVEYLSKHLKSTRWSRKQLISATTLSYICWFSFYIYAQRNTSSTRFVFLPKIQRWGVERIADHDKETRVCPCVCGVRVSR